MGVGAGLAATCPKTTAKRTKEAESISTTETSEGVKGGLGARCVGEEEWKGKRDR